MALTIGVDVGGTKIAGGLVDDDGQIIARTRRETPAQDSDATVAAIAAVAGELAAAHSVEGIGLSAAGFVDEKRATVLFAPNLAWRDEPLRALIEERTGLPVVVENDANAAAWGEARYGAGRGEPDLVCVTVGTGIGGGIVAGGALYRGRFGIGGEVGHMRVVPDGIRCGCGNKGCWEQYASGRALVREARSLVDSGSPFAAPLLELAHGDPDAIDGPVITRAARDGVPAAVELLEELGRWLGEGMASLAAVLDPGCFVVGGGVAAAGNLLLDPAEEAFRRALTGRGHRPVADVRLAGLGNDAGIVGAADLARLR